MSTAKANPASARPSRAGRTGTTPAATSPACDAASSPSARTWWPLSLAVFALGFLAYANTLRHGFVWDDTIWLDQKLRFYRGPGDAFFEPEFMPMRQVYRPLSQLTYWIDQSLWWRNAFGFHLTSVALHAANGVLVLWLARGLGLGPVAAVATSLLFLVHPIQPESVAWITNRVDVLATTFVLAAVLLARRRASPVTLALVALASFGAAASKETGCVVPLLVAALVLWVRPRDAREPAGAAWLLPLASLVGILPYFLLRPTVAATGIPLDALGGDGLLKLVGSFGYQVRRLVAPLDFAPYFAHVPLDPWTLGCAALGAVAAAVGMLARDPDGRRRFALGWVLVAAALPVVVALADFTSTPVAEHRLYLAVVGLTLLGGLGLDALPSLTITTAGRVGVGVALLALGTVTVLRNAYWRDDLTLWSAVVARVPDEPTPQMNLGLALAGAGRTAEAEAAYRRALALARNDVTRQRTSIDLGLIVVERGALDEAAMLFSAANAIGGHAIAYRGLAMVARQRAQAALRAGDTATADAELNEALADLKRALAINPRYPQAYLTLAGVLYDAGQFRNALAQYEQAAAIAGDDAVGRQATENARQLGAWLAAHPDAP